MVSCREMTGYGLYFKKTASAMTMKNGLWRERVRERERDKGPETIRELLQGA